MVRTAKGKHLYLKQSTSFLFQKASEKEKETMYEPGESAQCQYQVKLNPTKTKTPTLPTEA